MRPLRRYINEIANLSTLHAYINEATDNESKIEVKDVNVVWNGPDRLYVEIPESYSESDMQIYLDDIMLNNMPAGENHADDLFGANKDNIADAYLEYDSIEDAMGANQKPDIEWDSRYDSKISKDDKLKILCINKIRYNVIFDKFELVNVSEDDVKNELINIFTATNSSKINEYPFEIIFDSDNFEFKL